MKKTCNQGYVRDKIIAGKLNMQPVPFSGSRRELGVEDAEDELRLLQVKSTSRNALLCNFIDLFQLKEHAGEKIPVFALDFVSPSVRTVEGDLELPEELWVCVPIEWFSRLWECFLEKGAVPQG